MLRAAAAACLLAACGISAAARQVRIFTSKEQVATCEDMGLVNAHASGWGAKFRADAEDDAREKALKMAGDAIIVRQHEAGFSGHTIIAEVYRCNGWRSGELKAKAAPKPPPPLPELKKPTRLLVLDLKLLGVDPRVGAVLTNLVTAELQKVKNLSVIDHSSFDAAFDVERKKDLLGCDSTSCLSELAGALGTSLVLYGSVGTIGSQFAINVSLFDSRSTAKKATFSRTVANKEDELVRLVPEIASVLAQGLVEP
jgi:TolB-like protein